MEFDFDGLELLLALPHPHPVAPLNISGFNVTSMFFEVEGRDLGENL